MFSITPLYAGLLTFVFIGLSARVIQQRFAAKVSVGDGGDKRVIKAMRAQANFVEYAPLGLILLGMAELQGAPGWIIHLLGATLLAARLMHAIGFSRSPQLVKMRQLGVVLSFVMLLVTALACIGHALT